MNEIIFSGGRYYGVSALKSLQECFDCIYILNDNPQEILLTKRPADQLIDNFNDVDSPYVFLGGHADLITSEQLELKTYINIHGALLPKYRGMHPTFWAIVNEERELGITIHLVNEYMDAGDILTQYKFPYIGQKVGEINHQIDELVYLHSGKDVAAFIDNKIIPYPQNHEKAIFGCKRNLNDCLIDFFWDNKTLQLFFAALTPPYPLPRIMIKNQIYEVTAFELVYRTYFGAIGRVVNVDDRGIWIKTKDGFLVVSKIKNPENSQEFDPRKIVKIGYRMQSNLA